MAGIEWQQLTARERVDSGYILEGNSGLHGGLAMWLEGRGGLWNNPGFSLCSRRIMSSQEDEED